MIDNLFNTLDMRTSGQKVIEFRKLYNSLKHEAEAKAKPESCYLCHDKKTSYCNSHTIPRFCLKNITKSGRVKNAFSFFDTNLMLDNNGVNDAGTFHMICNKCDNLFFKDYETPENYYDANISNKILAQITTKNYLKLISKRLKEIELYKQFPNFSFFKNKQNINHIDLQEIQLLLNKSIEASKKDGNDYYVIFTKMLDYVTPIAYQGALVLSVDFNGEIINNIYNINQKYRMQYLHVCVFPMKNSTFIMLYIENGSTRYRSFYKHFKRLDDTKKLNVITYIILLYSEDYFINENLLKLVDANRMKEIARSSTVYVSNEVFSSVESVMKEDFNLSKWENCPNLLSKNYALR